MLALVAERLGTSRTIIRHYIQGRVACSKALKEEREALGDVAERRLYDLIDAGDFRAIAFYLTTMCRDRGYVLPKHNALEETNTVVQVIGSVQVIAVPPGQQVSMDAAVELFDDRSGKRIPALTLVKDEDDPTLQ